MKAWLVHQWCEPEQMTFTEVPTPEPGPRQVRIRNHAVALNFFDVLQIRGKYQIKPPLPFTPGAEVAGVVDAVGSGVENLTPGMRVTKNHEWHFVAPQKYGHGALGGCRGRIHR